MKQFTGLLLSQELKDKECFQMAPVILVCNETSEWWVGTLSHRSRDAYWAVAIPGMEDALCTESFSLCSLRVQNEDGIHTVDPKQWKKLMGLRGKSVEFVKKVLPYKPGYYQQECVSCGADFMAAKQQHYCEECCKSVGAVTVTTIQDVKIPKQSVKAISFTYHQVSVVNAFLKDRILNDVPFEDWLITKYGSNSIKHRG